MIKIVDPTPDRSVVKQAICRSCGVKLEYVPIDIKERVVQDYGGGHDTIRWIICPSCNNNVTVR